MTDPVGKVVELNGRWPLWLPDHRAAQWDRPGGWEAERLSSMAEHIQPGMVVYDVGAEQGDISALCAMWAQDVNAEEDVALEDWHRGIGGGVVLFEPSYHVWPNIRAIFEANGLPLPLGCFVGFAGEIDRSVTGVAVDLHAKMGWPGCAAGPINANHGFCNLWERNDLPVIRIETVAKQLAPPDAITIDAEGSEYRVLSGAQYVLANDRPYVWVSIHPHLMQEHYGDEPDDLHALMAGFDYDIELLGEDHELHYLYVPSETT